MVSADRRPGRPPESGPVLLAANKRRLAGCSSGLVGNSRCIRSAAAGRAARSFECALLEFQCSRAARRRCGHAGGGNGFVKLDHHADYVVSEHGMPSDRRSKFSRLWVHRSFNWTYELEDGLESRDVPDDELASIGSESSTFQGGDLDGAR